MNKTTKRFMRGKNYRAGYTKDGVPVLNGELVFWRMDTIGLPLEIINEVLREHSMCFDVVSFVNAAINSKNFTYQTIRKRLREGMLDDPGAFLNDLDKVAKIKGWIN